jgi:hypothetical protein
MPGTVGPTDKRVSAFPMGSHRPFRSDRTGFGGCVVADLKHKINVWHIDTRDFILALGT